MRIFISLLAAALLGVVALTACNSTEKSAAANASKTAPSAATQNAQATPGDGVRRVTTVDLKNALDSGSAIVIDVRSDAAYKQGHIKGARLIPAGEIANHLGELPRDKEIILYCS